MIIENDAERIFNPATYASGVPFGTLRRLRQRSAVTWIDEPALLGWPGGSGFWLVLRHAEAVSVMMQPNLFSSSLGGTQIRDPASPAALNYVRRMMLNMDPPEHSRLRRLLARSFTARALARLEERIRGHARAIVQRAAAAGQGRCDFVKDLAADLPLLALCEILGVPPEDRMLMYDWSNRVIGYQDPDYCASDRFDLAAGSPMAREALRLRPRPDAEGRMPDPRTREGMPDLYAYSHLLAREKRQAPGADIMSILLEQVDEKGNRVSLEEFENMFWLFAVAGNETLRNGLPGACIALIENPAIQDELRSDPASMGTAVDEFLRWWTPVMNFRRTAAADCAIGTQEIRAGDKVVVSFISANRDDRVFDAPDRLDIHRDPNPHLSFGQGPHFCLGAQLARMQMRALLGEVLQQIGTLQYEGVPKYLVSNFQRGVKSLPIRWRQGRAS